MRICLITDFFYPNIGGVESHTYFIAYCYMQLGHKVVIITWSRPGHPHTGVRYYNNGIKVYYIPDSFPTVSSPAVLFTPRSVLIKNILKREKIQILHG